MSKRLSSERLEEIERRCLAATAGPWRSLWKGQEDDGEGVIATPATDMNLVGATKADQDFIASARQDLPALLEEIKVLRSELGRFLFS